MKNICFHYQLSKGKCRTSVPGNNYDVIQCLIEEDWVKLGIISERQLSLIDS